MATEFNNIDFGFRYGTQRAIDTTYYHKGTFNVATDTGELYVDIGGSRVAMNKDIHLVNTEVELRAMTNPTSDRVYYTKDTMKLFVYDETRLRWNNIGGSPDEILARVESLAQVVAAIHSFEIIILESADDLPEVGESHIIYFVPQDTPTEENIKYEEYVWVSNEGYYEKIGIAEADLTNYYTKGQVDAIIGENYVTNPSDVNYKGTVSTRLYNAENSITEYRAEIGPMDSTASGFVTIGGRLTEIEHKLGASMDPSSTSGFKSVDTRLDTLESASSTDSEDITEIKAKFGAYPDSTDSGFTTVENRFAEIEAKIGSTMDPSSTSGFQTIDTRLDTLESASTTAANDIAEFKLQLGNYPKSYNVGFVTIDNRFKAVEQEVDDNQEANQTAISAVADRATELEAKLGDMGSSSATGFKTVDERLNILETTGAVASDVAELAKKIGDDYPSSDDPEFISIFDRLTDIENRLSVIEHYALSTPYPIYTPPTPNPEPDPENGD